MCSTQCTTRTFKVHKVKCGQCGWAILQLVSSHLIKPGVRGATEMTALGKKQKKQKMIFHPNFHSKSLRCEIAAKCCVAHCGAISFHSCQSFSMCCGASLKCLQAPLHATALYSTRAGSIFKEHYSQFASVWKI